MDVKLIPGDRKRRAFTAGMFDGLVYLVNTVAGTAKVVFDCETIVPHIEVPVRGGMTQLLAMPESGDRLIFGSFQAGQVGMLDVSDPNHPVQASIVNLGVGAGPHDIVLSDDERPPVSDPICETRNPPSSSGRKSSVMLESGALVENRKRGLRASETSKKKMPFWPRTAPHAPGRPSRCTAFSRPSARACDRDRAPRGRFPPAPARPPAIPVRPTVYVSSAKSLLRPLRALAVRPTPWGTSARQSIPRAFPLGGVSLPGGW